MASRVPVIFQEKDTFLHRRDPRVKIILFLLLLALIVTARSWPWMAAALVLAGALALSARAPRGWMLVLWLIHLPSFLFAFAVPLVKTWSEGDIDRFFSAAEGTLRLVLAWTTAIVLSVALFSATDAKSIARGLRALRAPALVALSFQLSYRLLYTLMSEAVEITKAMQLKGVELNPRRPLELVANTPRVAVPLTLAVLRQAPTLMSALHIRGISKVRPVLDPLDRWDGGLLVIGGGLYAGALLDALGVL